MKKVLFIAASLLAAGSLMADVTIDLSAGSSIAETGATSVVNYANNVCTATISTTATYKAGGVEFDLATPIAASSIKAITGNIKCDATGDYMELAIFVRDANGNRWWSGTALSPYLLSEWTALNEVPSVSYWDGQSATDFASQSIVSVAVNLSPGVVLNNYAVSVKDLVIETQATDISNVTANQEATKRFVNGQLVIEHDGVRYNAIGQMVK